MPFFPRILVHLVGLGSVIRQGCLVEGLLGQSLQAMAEFQKSGAFEFEFTGQARRRGSLGDAAQNQHHLRWPLGRTFQGRSGKGVEHPLTGAASIVQNRIPIPTMDVETGPCATLRTAKAGRVQQFNQFGVAGVLVHEVLKREIHEIILDRSNPDRNQLENVTSFLASCKDQTTIWNT
jgi:hypothetical protein